MIYIFSRLYLPLNEDLKENATECDLIPMNLPNSNTTNCLKVNIVFHAQIFLDAILNYQSGFLLLFVSLWFLLGTWKAQRYWKSCFDYTWLPQWIWYWMDARNAKRHSENWFNHHESWSYCKLANISFIFHVHSSHFIVFRWLDGAEVS